MMIDDHDDDDKAEKIASYECFLHLFEEVVIMMMIYEDGDDYDNDFSLMIMMTTITTTSMSASFTSWRRLFYFLVFYWGAVYIILHAVMQSLDANAGDVDDKTFMITLKL